MFQGMLPRIVSIIFWASASLALSGVAFFVHAQPRAASSTPSSKRVALIIGNGSYSGDMALSNPINDATGFAGALAKVSPKFDILLRLNLNAEQTEEVLREFESKLQGAEVGLFYFAGHALQVAGENYILPIDVPSDFADSDELNEINFAKTIRAFHLNHILERMENQARVKLAFLDACRNNPWIQKENTTNNPKEGSLKRSVKRFPSSVSLPGGLAPIESKASASLIAFATSPGEDAEDGFEGHSPFTLALIHHIAEQGADIQEIIRLVNKEVQEKTAAIRSGRQIPWVNHSFIDKFYLWPWTEKQQSGFLALAEQIELKRLQCLAAQPSSIWGSDARRAAVSFNSHSDLDVKLEVDAPSEEDIRRLRSLDKDVCPKLPDIKIPGPTLPKKGGYREGAVRKQKESGGRYSAQSFAGRSSGSPSPSLGGGIGAGGF